MRKYGWVKKSGAVCQDGIMREVMNHADANRLFLAYSTDSFLAGHGTAEELEKLSPENLLEIRIFSEDQEVCFRRSLAGEAFQWRIASEENLASQYYFIQYQTIDINQDRSGEQYDKMGRRILFTTGGGKYMLPIGSSEDSVKVIAYIDYDENGMAKIVDYRLCQFIQRGRE